MKVHGPCRKSKVESQKPYVFQVFSGPKTRDSPNGNAARLGSWLAMRYPLVCIGAAGLRPKGRQLA